MSTNSCGTYAGYQRHVRAHEAPCAACRRAAAAYARERRKSAFVKAREKEQNDARYRAWVRLARMHPLEYQALYAEELKT